MKGWDATAVVLTSAQNREAVREIMQKKERFFLNIHCGKKEERCFS